MTDRQRFAAEQARLYWAVQARAVLLRAIRQFFDRRHFCEVDPPQVATSPGLELHLDAMRVQVRTGMGGPMVERFLTTSPEYFCKRLLSAGFDRIYVLQHAFRSGEHSQLHNPEFMMLEWYRADADWRTIVADCKTLFRHCWRALHVAELAPLWQRPSVQPAFNPDLRWQTLSVRQALRQWAGFDCEMASDTAVMHSAKNAGIDVRPADTLADVLMQALVERVDPPLASLPTVVLAPWPRCLGSLACPVPGHPQRAERFEIYHYGLELANGFSELTDAPEQRRRFEQDLADRRRLQRPMYPIDERFLAALANGMPPAAGVAVGVDRLLMALIGAGDIGDVLPFGFEQA